ncbi:SLC13 family permease [Nesterenkonia flava]|uniref:Na+/H+ antiporter NhaC family protein n=1 Tax=Nesterenkonia flava TaxID=469799 RepID=A0ABU1FVL8_9MICC|nr:SLC13 family permease [Nesterenkonia flava]MDR5712711.1 Na+/H+ antiporter NhaC family protein [Nesterenkonia flava]
MAELLNPVILSVLVLVALSLSRVNVVIALLLAAAVGGVAGGLSLEETFSVLIDGLGGQGETALSYILLGTLAVMVARSGLTRKLIRRVMPLLRGPRAVVLFAIAGLACFSQNLVPVHIAFIPILIPPLLAAFDRMKIDRRGVAVALTFGLKAPYLIVPLGFGLIFQGIIVDAMAENGMEISLGQIPLAMAIPVGAMGVGLAIAVLVTYRKDREYTNPQPLTDDAANPLGALDAGDADLKWRRGDYAVLIGLAVTLALQLVYGSLVMAALAGVVVIFVLGGERWTDGDPIVDRGVAMMGTIAFIMLVASGYASVLTETGAVEDLVASTSDWIGDSRLLTAVIMMLVGLVVTMGIGTSFGTVPVLAAFFVPLAAAVGFSPLATAALIGAAGAIGDAGAPASDSTLGPTSGLNADGQHHHIWDTCVPTFLHYNVLLFAGGVLAAMVL